MGVMVCVVSFNLVFKMDKPTEKYPEGNKTLILTDLSKILIKNI